jgi:DNA mismatch repair protein MutS2
MQALLYNQKEKPQSEKNKKNFEAKYIEVDGDIGIGDAVKMKKSHQVGTVREIRGRKAVVQVGLIPITINLTDLVRIRDKIKPETPA